MADVGAIAELYAPEAVFYSHPFRDRQGPDGLVVEQLDAWGETDGYRDPPAWAPER